MLRFIKNFSVFLVLLSLLSCGKIDTVVASFFVKEDAMDFTQIDRYPVFEKCDPLLSYEETRLCFEKAFYQKINQRIQNLKFKTDVVYTDTLMIKFSIDTTGHFKCKEVEVSDKVKFFFPNLTTEIRKIIHGFQPISPALKRDIPVPTHYVFPVVIETK